MTQERQAVTAERLAGLNEQVERWRRERTKRSPMPSHLWDQAVSLARQMGVNPVAEAVGLNYESLSQRVALGGVLAARSAPGAFVELAVPRRAAQGGALAAKAGPGAFVELTAPRLAALPPSGELVVEVSDPQGVRLTVRLSGGSALDVVRLVEAFQRRAA